MNPNLSSFLNMSRWLAAFLVVIAHIRHLIWVDYAEVVQKTVLVKGIYFVTGLGHEAVVIFFVISGFLVGGLTLSKWLESEPDLGAYASARVSRIYIVFIPALFIGLGLDWFGLHWFNTSELYTDAAKYSMSVHPDIAADMTFTTLVGNLFMMQNILVGTFGSNAPLWSLAYEWWYYCLFGLFAFTFTAKSNSRIVFGLLGITLTFLLPSKILLWGCIWALGLVAHIWLKSKAWRPSAWLGIGTFCITMIASRLSHSSENTTDTNSYLIEFSRDFFLATGFVVALVSTSRLDMKMPLSKLSAWLAEFSYSTYLIHFPVLLLIVAFCFQVFDLKFQVQPSSLGFIYMTALTFLVYVVCYFFAWLTERHTHIIRKKLDRLLVQSSHA
ncbi:hypothetical protein os4_28220 [Comamonadaceae bacterium OS-4]|nr:hypothetical protein os4_28220 [Comamonadaceae bacterium OS-4]